MAVDYSANPKKKSGAGVLIAFFAVFIIACAALIIAKYRFTIDKVDVTGNSHYSEKEIEDLVLSGEYGHNSIWLYIKCRSGYAKEIPFIEKLDVELLSPRSVRIQVYEKAIAGKVEYLGRFLYFDKDGIIVESSMESMDSIPFVTGLSFDHMQLHEKLPVENEEVFRLILNITQLLTKYEIMTDKIYFDSGYNITLYYGNSRIYLGQDDYIDEKINRLRFLLPKLEGFSGVLHMENYTGEGDKFTFSRDENTEQQCVNISEKME